MLHQNPCPICKFNSIYIFTSKHQKKIYECQNLKCGHFHTPIVYEQMGVEKLSIDQLNNLESTSDSNFKKSFPRDKRLLSLFLQKLGKREKFIFLDYGAGTGYVSRSFKKILGDKCDIYCFEPYEIFYQIYQKNGLITLKNLQDLNDSTVDIAYLNEVIEHIDDPIEALKELRPKIKKNGLIFISTPIGKRTENEQCSWAYDTETHVHFFTENSLNLALVSADLIPILNDFYPEMYLPSLVPQWIKDLRRLLSNAYQHMNGRKPNVGHLVGFTRSID
jgi:2-polyprenyl-3-methyl-5-hydroxy-6-metoxy-1,4-benzoquinol methylase